MPNKEAPDNCIKCVERVMTGNGSEAICGLTGKNLGDMSWSKQSPDDCPLKTDRR